MLLGVESTDVLFAVDSIPAIFVVTSDPFLSFTLNIFAILGLRSVYFVLASILAGHRDSVPFQSPPAEGMEDRSQRDESSDIADDARGNRK